MSPSMQEAIERLNRKRSPFPDYVVEALIREQAFRSWCYRVRRKVGDALVDCFNEGRPWSHISQKPKEVIS